MATAVCLSQSTRQKLSWRVRLIQIFIGEAFVLRFSHADTFHVTDARARQHRCGSLRPKIWGAMLRHVSIINQPRYKGISLQSAKRLDLRFVLRTVAAGFISACWLQPAVALPSADQALDPAEAQARASWRADIALIEVPADGCFHAAYPNLFWERVPCGAGQPRTHTLPRKVKEGGTDVVGNGHDYAAGVTGLISQAYGTFPTVTGVKSEKSVGVAIFGDGGILGPNEYTLQINTMTT